MQFRGNCLRIVHCRQRNAKSRAIEWFQKQIGAARAAKVTKQTFGRCPGSGFTSPCHRLSWKLGMSQKRSGHCLLAVPAMTDTAANSPGHNPVSNCSAGATALIGRRQIGGYFHIGFPDPGSPNRDHFSFTVSITSSVMRILVPHSRLVSGGHLLVASRPILEPRPSSGLAKSR